MANNRNKISPSKGDARRPVDALFDQYSEHHQNSRNKLIHWFCVPLIVFSLFGLFWAIPFPYLKFLGVYNGFINWASFLMAFAIFYYYRLSPKLSYIMLLVLFIFSYFVTLLAGWQAAGGPALWLVSLIIFVLAWVGQFIGHKIEGKRPSFLADLKFLLIGPIWLLANILRRFSIKY